MVGRLPVEHQKLLRNHGYQDSMDDLEQAVEQNNETIINILKYVGLFENVTHPGKAETDPRVRPGAVDMDKVHSTLKQIGGKSLK